MEDIAHCGPRGYLIHFGLRNCLKFTSEEVLSRFSDKGKEFVACTTKCLISHLEQLFKFSLFLSFFPSLSYSDYFILFLPSYCLVMTLLVEDGNGSQSADPPRRRPITNGLTKKFPSLQRFLFPYPRIKH
uniref:Uncharacterized protein n=1 Tax=Heterorhabditis bacteriophora TaxID=37862 RepID=A0A1I7XPF9_HETBA